jgi:hypothetical protein
MGAWGCKLTTDSIKSSQNQHKDNSKVAYMKTGPAEGEAMLAVCARVDIAVATASQFRLIKLIGCLCGFHC